MGDGRAHRTERAHLIRQKSVDSYADSNAADRPSTCTTLEPCRSGVSGRQRTLRPDLRICECRCGAPGWRTTRLGVGDPM